MAHDEAQYCAEQVRRFDRDRWLSTLLAPDAAQRDLLVLYAFNLELARIRELVREPHMGLIRLQWWRDAVSEAAAGAPRRHPVCSALAPLLADDVLQEAELQRMIDAREKDIEDTPCADMSDLIAYADSTAGTLAALAMRASGCRDAAAEAAARRLGRAWGLTGIIRAAAFHASTGRCCLPTQALLRQRVSLESWLAGRPEPGARAVVQGVAEAAAKMLAEIRRSDVPPAGFGVAALRVLARIHLRRIARAGYDAFAPALQAPMPMVPARLLLARMLGSW